MRKHNTDIIYLATEILATGYKHRAPALVAQGLSILLSQAIAHTRSLDKDDQTRVLTELLSLTGTPPSQGTTLDQLWDAWAETLPPDAITTMYTHSPHPEQNESDPAHA